MKCINKKRGRRNHFSKLLRILPTLSPIFAKPTAPSTLTNYPKTASSSSTSLNVSYASVRVPAETHEEDQAGGE